MARYIVLQRSFIDNAIVEEGQVVEYDGRPGINLQLAEGEKPYKAPKGQKSEPAEPLEPSDSVESTELV